MLNNVNYIKLKNNLLKYFKNEMVVIELKGNLETKLVIHEAKILINKRKVIILNDDLDFSTEFRYIKKIKFDGNFKLILQYKDYHILLEV